MKALVTGAAGFVGRHLCLKLEAMGYELVRIDSQPTHSAYCYKPLLCTVQEFIDQVPQATFDLVVHLAANIVNIGARMKGGMDMYDDIELDLAMCRWLEKNPPNQCAVLMSSCAVDYPEDPYCIVKRNLESFAQTLHKKGVPVIVLRPFSGYGEDQSEEYPFRAILERALRREDPLTVWGGDQVRDWIHIDDLTDAILFAVKKFPKSGYLYTLPPLEVGTGLGTSLKMLAQFIADTVGYSPDIHCDYSRPSSSKSRVASGHILREDVASLQSFGWLPKVGLEEGIRRAVQSRQKAEASCPA